MKMPFSPAIYEHAARFAERTPWDVSRDPELLYRGHRGAFEAYRHTPVCVGIDIYNLETEAYGARVEEPVGDAIPAIHRPLFESLEDAFDLPPFDPATAGRIAMTIAVGQRLQRDLPEADVRIPIAGPFSIAFNLFGINNLCMDAALRPEDLARVLLRLAENQTVFCHAIRAAGLKPAFFESAATPPILSPAQFREIELPALRRILQIAADVFAQPVPCIMGGNTYLILDDLLSTGTNYLVCNVETNQAAFLRRVHETHPHVKVRVNMDPAIVAGHNRERLGREIERVLALRDIHPNCLLGTGALPYETPIENVHWIKEYLHD